MKSAFRNGLTPCFARNICHGQVAKADDVHTNDRAESIRRCRKLSHKSARDANLVWQFKVGGTGARAATVVDVVVPTGKIGIERRRVHAFDMLAAVYCDEFILMGYWNSIVGRPRRCYHHRGR